MRTMIAMLLGSVLFMTADLGAAGAADAPPKTVVLVHGAFATAASWDKVVPLLKAKGLNVIAVDNPLTSLADDVSATKIAIDAAPGPVILVGHSWGGVVIGAAGNDDKVKALVYVAAFAPPPGVSINELSAGQPPLPWLAGAVPDDKGFLTLNTVTVGKYFAQDLSGDDLAAVTAGQGKTFAGLFDEKVASPAYLGRPSWYIVAKADGMIPPPAEQAMAAGIKATTSEVDGSHVIMLSKPQDVTDVILAAAAAVK